MWIVKSVSLWSHESYRSFHFCFFPMSSTFTALPIKTDREYKLTDLDSKCNKQHSETPHFVAASFIQPCYYRDLVNLSIGNIVCDCLTAIGSPTRCFEPLVPLLLWQPPLLAAASLRFQVTAFTNTRQSLPLLSFLVPHQHFSSLDSQHIRRLKMTSRRRSLLSCSRFERE